MTNAHNEITKTENLNIKGNKSINKYYNINNTKITLVCE